jgi:TonB family protein
MWSILTLSLAFLAAGGHGLQSADERKGCETIKGEPVDLSKRKMTDADGIEMPVRIHNVDPEIPKALLDKGLRGLTAVKVLLSQSGCVENVTIVKSSSHKAVDDAVVAAVKRWRYTPTKRAGQPVPAFLVALATFGPSSP